MPTDISISTTSSEIHSSANIQRKLLCSEIPIPLNWAGKLFGRLTVAMKQQSLVNQHLNNLLYTSIVSPVAVS